MTSATLRPLSRRQEAVLAQVVRSWQERGFGPTLREIQDATGISSSSVVDYALKGLEKRGLVVIEREIARAIRPTCLEGWCPVCGRGGAN